jgi:glycerophosphoryl diester phosphodiesterase
MSDLDWLIARPVAHRGLHDAQKNVIENTPSAFAAAITGGYGIECDLQITGDGEAMVHHDEALGRLTHGDGRLDAMTAADLKRIAFKATADRMITLGELCDLVAGRATLVIELKSRFDGDSRLVARAAEVLAGYAGPAAVMSFDPAQITALRQLAPGRRRGMVAERRYRHHEWDRLPAATRRAMTYFQHARRTSPQFIAYSVADLPAAIPTLARKLFGLPLLTWTVRSADDRRKAERYADQMIFEGFRP